MGSELPSELQARDGKSKSEADRTTTQPMTAKEMTAATQQTTQQSTMVDRRD
jgi:hypothetical protein